MVPGLNTILVVAAAGFAFSLSPGPSMLFVMSRSIGQSRQAGLASAAGLALGGMCLAALTALGAGAILADSSSLFSAVRLLGGAYLAYLGVRALIELRAYRFDDDLEVSSGAPLSTAVRQGFLVELLNPKTVLFFLAFLPGFIDPSAGHVGSQMLVLGLLIPLTAIPSDVMVSFLAGSFAEHVNDHPKYGLVLEVVSAAILLLLAARVFWG